MTTLETLSTSAASEIERLVALKEQGLLTDEEFEQAKKLTVATINEQTATPLLHEPYSPPEAEPKIDEYFESKKRAKQSATQVIGYTNKYSTALMLGSLISGIGWLVVIVGIIGTFIAMGSTGIAGLAVLSVSILGVVAIASGQLIGAAVDVANNSAGILALEKAKWDRENG